MSHRCRKLPLLNLFWLLVLVSALGGASAQEGRTPRQRPRPPQDTASPAPNPSAGPRETRPMGGMETQHSRRSSQFAPDALPSRRAARINLYPGTRIIVPPAWERCRLMPTVNYWQRRDLSAELQWLSRSGFVPVTPLGNSVEAISDFTQMPAGWRAYGLCVPAGGTLQVEVSHPKLGWFRLLLVNQWGQPGPGMMQAAMAHQPVLVTYKNPSKDATAVYVIVDDPAWWSDADNPYTLLVRRDWDPAKTDLSKVSMVTGLWGASPSVSAEFRGPSLTGPAVYPH